MSDVPDDKTVRDEAARLYMCAAIGANEQARATEVFGEKIWWRMIAEHYARCSREFGGDFKFVDNDAILIAPFGPMYIKFFERDLPELRRIVAEWDAKANEKGEAG